MKLLKKIVLVGMMAFSFQMVFAKGEDFSNLKLKDVNGMKYSFDENQKETYIKLWASWCPVCLSGLEEIENLSKENNNFEVITVVFPEQHGEKSSENFKKWYNSLGYKNIKVLLDEKGEISNLIKPRAFPTSVILDKNGRVKKVIVGHIDSLKIKSYFSESMEMKKDNMMEMKEGEMKMDEMAGASKKMEKKKK